jgi:GAF domain-containing protein
MISLFSNAFPLRLYPDLVQRRRAIGTYTTAVLGALAALLLLVLLPLDYVILTEPQQVLFIIFSIALLVAGIIAVYLTRLGNQQAASYLVIVCIYIAPLVLTVSGAIDARAFLVVAMVVISLSGFLIGGRGPILTSAITMFAFAWTFTASPIFTTASWATLIGLYSPSILIHGAINYLIGQSLPTLAHQASARDSERRSKLSEASNAVSQRLLSARLDLDVLLKEIVRLVRDTFPDVNQVQIYLIDTDRSKATLMATTADDVSARHAAYSVGSLSLVGRVSLSSQSLVARDSDAASTGDRAYMRLGFLPETHAETAIPMRLGQEVFGILDLHSDNPSAFLAEDIGLFETLANQIAVAIDNARLFQEAQSQVNENKRLYEQTRANLREIERLNRQLTGAAWTEYLNSTTEAPSFTIDMHSKAVDNVAAWTPTMAEASRRLQPIVNDYEHMKVVSVPISVRGQVIGAMEFELEPNQLVTPEQLIIVHQAVERLGLTADNARMFEDTQRAAHREAMVNEISTRIQSMTSVDAVVATAAQSLGEALRVNRIAIRLGTPEEKEQS